MPVGRDVRPVWAPATGKAYKQTCTSAASLHILQSMNRRTVKSCTERSNSSVFTSHPCSFRQAPRQIRNIRTPFAITRVILETP